VVPAVLTIAWQSAARQYESRRQRSERLINVFLDLRSEANAITYQGVFTNAHASAVAKTTGVVALLLELLQPFDLTGMSRELIARMTRLTRLANELLATTKKESTHAAVRRAVDATRGVLECYAAPEETRVALRRLWSSRPPLDEAKAEARTETMHLAFRELEAALTAPRRPGWHRRDWP
jgi:hypothetical protein